MYVTAAALGVRISQSPKSSSATSPPMQQSYFNQHDDDILCLTISHSRRIVATGQTASHTSKGKAHVCLWDASDCRLLTRMDGCHQRGVVSLAFSFDDTMLLSIGLDDSNTHIVWVSSFICDLCLISFKLRSLSFRCSE